MQNDLCRIAHGTRSGHGGGVAIDLDARLAQARIAAVCDGCRAAAYVCNDGVRQ
jgi:hypothetical protein